MSCKRCDCLYHPDYRLGYNCDYMLLTGEKRDSPPGRRCNKYKYATSEEQSKIRRRKPIILTDELDEHCDNCDFIKILNTKKE